MSDSAVSLPQARSGRGGYAPRPIFKYGALRDPNGQMANYDQAGNLIDTTPTGQRILRPGQANQGATKPAMPQNNIGGIPAFRMPDKPPVDPGMAQPATPANTNVNGTLDATAKALGTQPSAPVQGPTPSGATLDSAQKPNGDIQLSAPAPKYNPQTLQQKMDAFNNRDRTAERGDVGIRGGSGQGAQTLGAGAYDGRDPGTVTNVGPARVASATENAINTPLTDQERQAAGASVRMVQPGSALAADHYVGDGTATADHPIASTVKLAGPPAPASPDVGTSLTEANPALTGHGGILAPPPSSTGTPMTVTNGVTMNTPPKPFNLGSASINGVTAPAVPPPLAIPKTPALLATASTPLPPPAIPPMPVTPAANVSSGSISMTNPTAIQSPNASLVGNLGQPPTSSPATPKDQALAGATTPATASPMLSGSGLETPEEMQRRLRLAANSTAIQ